MDEIRKRLCENEDLLADFCRKNGIKYSASTKKRYFSELTHDGDLLHYIKTSMSSEDMKVFSNVIHGYDYETCLDIINDYFTSLNVNDYLDITALKPQDQKKLIEITIFTGFTTLTQTSLCFTL